MELIDLIGGGKVIRGYVVAVPHNDHVLVFDGNPLKEENYYEMVYNAQQRGLRLPTTAEAISLLKTVVNNPDNLQDILRSFVERGVLTCTKNLKVNEGIYVYDDIDFALDRCTETQLSSMFERGDKSVRFTDYDVKTRGYLSLNEFENCDYVQAQVGEKNLEDILYIIEFLLKKIGSSPFIALPLPGGVEKTYTSISTYGYRGGLGNVHLCGGEVPSLQRHHSFGIKGCFRGQSWGYEPASRNDNALADRQNAILNTEINQPPTSVKLLTDKV